MGNDFSKFLVSHWRGEYSLPRAFWIHYLAFPVSIGAVIFFYLLDPFLVFTIPRVFDSRYCIPSLLLLVQFSIWIWALKGTFCSAKFHVARGGTSEWKWLTLSALIVNVVVVVLFLTTALLVSAVLLDAAFYRHLFDPKWFDRLGNLLDRVINYVRNGEPYPYRA